MEPSERVCPRREQVAHRKGNRIYNGICADCGAYVGSGRRARPHNYPRGTAAFDAQNQNYHGGANPHY